MPTYVTSAHSWEEVCAEYEDCASYDVAADADLCKRFIVAARILLRRIQTRAKHGGGEVEYDPAQISAELDKAESWLAANDATSTSATNVGGVRALGVETFR